MRAKLILILLLALGAYVPHTSAAEKHQLAAELYDACILSNAEPLMEAFYSALNREMKLPPEVLKLHKDAYLGVMQSEELRRAYIEAYVQLFSEQELAGILELSKNPVFLAFDREKDALAKLTDPTFNRLISEATTKLKAQLAERGLTLRKK